MRLMDDDKYICVKWKIPLGYRGGLERSVTYFIASGKVREAFGDTGRPE